MDAQAPRSQRALGSDFDLRSASGFMAQASGAGKSLADLPRACGGAACICARPGLHARRVVAGDGAPLLRFLGVPVHRLLRADIALRYAGRPQGTDRCPARAWHRCDTRLGPVAFPQRRTRTCLLRRHASVRARRRASGLSPGVEELHLQLRPPRSAGVPGVERSVLARRVSCRRTESRCRRIHALP